MVINQRRSALQFCAHKPNAISRSGKASTLLHSPVQTLHYETLSAWMPSLISRRAHLGHAANESDLGNALALVLSAKAPGYEMRILRKSFRREAGFIGG